MDEFGPDDMEESTSWGVEGLKKKIKFFEETDPKFAAILKRQLDALETENAD